MVRVICIGSVSKDIFFPTDEGVIIETPEDLASQTKVAFELGGKFRAKDRFEAVGGVAANVSQGLSRLGVSAWCYSKVGRDEIGNWIEKELVRNEVHLESFFIDPKVKSDLSAIIVITQTGDRLIFHNRDANEKLEIIPEKLEGADWYFVSALNGPWEKNLTHILELRRSHGIHLAMNPGQHNLKGNPKLILEALREIDVLFLNKDEALELLLKGGIEDDPKKLKSETFLIEKLHEQGVGVVALTDGKRGAWASFGDDIYHADIYEPKGLVDTTGAGDAFASGFFGAYLHKLPVEACLQYGIANAGSVVGSYGASSGLLNQEEIHAYLKEIHPKETTEQVISVRGE
ncbi:MAG: carbohydrate kinase family protein [Candidatus Moraniibacteriota bacterium]